MQPPSMRCNELVLVMSSYSTHRSSRGSSDIDNRKVVPRGSPFVGSAHRASTFVFLHNSGLNNQLAFPGWRCNLFIIDIYFPHRSVPTSDLLTFISARSPVFCAFPDHFFQT